MADTGVWAAGRRPPDDVFADPRLVALYDAVDGPRSDLHLYRSLVEEFGARTVLDIGCGTGSFAVLLAERGVRVVGLDPARASLDVARGKPHADRVRWLLGDTTALPPLQVDLATMTGNVAQVFLTDAEWSATLIALRAALRPGGRLVFESRRPDQQAWRSWTRGRSTVRTEVPGSGCVTAWVEVTEVHEDLVSFRWTFRFEETGVELTSDSTLRFRTREQLADSLAAAGFTVQRVLDAPDRPRLEFVFVAQRR